MQSLSTEQQVALRKAAESARENAYAPFSHFRVGAAVLTSDGRIYGGTNVENSSYGLTICAERTAVCSAVADGAVDPKSAPIVAVMIIAEGKAAPCGACRQFLYELGPDAQVLLAPPGSSTVSEFPLKDLLPNGFRLAPID